MTSAKIDELDAMRAKATAGEWHACENGAIGGGHLHQEQDEESGQVYVVSCQHVIAGCDGRDDREYIAALHNAYPQLAALIRQQQAVIDRLPKTADGVPITPGMLVWENDGSNQIADDGTPYEGFKVLTIGSEHNYDRQRKQWVVLDGIGEVTTDRFYSTREGAIEATRSAAEQAKGGA